MEPLPTVLAGVGPGVGVDEEVRGQGGRALEHFTAHLAAKATLLDTQPHMHTLMCVQCVCTEGDKTSDCVKSLTVDCTLALP